MADLAIQVDAVSKDFKLPHQKTNTVKSLFTGLFSKMDRGYEVQHALRDISFEIKEGEFFGIVGRNGSGKSTLLKIIAGIYQPTKGKVTLNGKLVPFIELGVGFNPELTGRENVYLNGALLGFTKKEIDAMYDDIVAFAELERFMDQKLKNYSSGMQVRLAFSMATRSEADILLVDEVLAVGDANFQRKCFDYFRSLKKNKKTVVFVSHDMSAVQQYCDRAMLIEKSEIVTIGDPVKIGGLYNKMFTDESDERINKIAHLNTDKSPSGEERWGDGAANFESVKTKLEAKDGSSILEIKATVLFNEDIEVPIFGYSVKNYLFNQLVGTNTVRKHIKMSPRKKGERVEVVWRLPNIFNEGTHYVDCTVAHDSATSVSDRWPDAASFEVIREDNNPYLVWLSDDTVFTIVEK